MPITIDLPWFKRYIMKQVPKNERPFPIAMNNLYFKQLATHTVMTSLFHSSLTYGLRKM